jgi:hypothetical protein
MEEKPPSIDPLRPWTWPGGLWFIVLLNAALATIVAWAFLAQSHGY